MDNFAGTISSLGHGCVANIATQAKIALYQSLITDPYDQILFGAFKEKISGAILNSGGDLLTGSAEGINVFNNHDINKNFISPNGLLTALAEEFYANGKIKKNAVEFIEKEFGKDGRNNLVGSILENDHESFDQEMAKISAYVILQKPLPDLCENKYLTKPKADYLEIIQEAVKLNPNSCVIPEESSQVVAGQRVI